MPFISDLDEDYPDGAVHAGSVLDDDLRSIKAILLDQFPNVTGVVTPDHHYVNRAAGITSNVQDQLDNEDDGFVAITDSPYMISGRVSGTTIVGPYGYPAMLGTWGVSQGAPGTTTVVHNMDVLIGLGLNDYVVTVSPITSGADMYPLMAITQGAFSFTVETYNSVSDEYLHLPFYFQIVIIP